MATFDITPVDKIIPKLSIQTTTIESLSDQLNNHIESMRDLGNEYKVKIMLNPDNIYKIDWPQEFKKISNYSYPLRGIKSSSEITREFDNSERDWLCMWEVYARSFIPDQTSKVVARGIKNGNKSFNMKGIPIRTFHIHDNNGCSSRVMQYAINKIESDTGSQINWDWISTYTPTDSKLRAEARLKDKDKWFIGADDTGDLNVANMRAWRNKITMNMKVVHNIISCSRDATKAIAFALINLTAGGSAIIYIPQLATAAITSMIHLFSNYFESTKLIHTTSTDEIFLYGMNHLGVKSPREILYNYCAQDNPNLTIFTPDYIDSKQFNCTIDKLIHANVNIYGQRYVYYDTLLSHHLKLSNDASSKIFEQYIDDYLTEHYPDESSKWVTLTGFTAK